MKNGEKPYGHERVSKKCRKSNSRTFSGLQFSTLDWGELDPFYLEHPEEIPIEHEFVGYRQDGDVAEDYQGNLYLILCDPGIHRSEVYAWNSPNWTMP